MNKNLFISIEGPDGSGKTTAIRKLEKNFNSLFPNTKVIFTREPGGTGVLISEKIRELVLESCDMPGITEAFLFAASRSAHIEEIIKPATTDGKLVICDRFIDSSIVYQGIGRKLGIDKVMEINKYAIDGMMPGMTVFFDISPELGLARILENRSDEQNRLDVQPKQFHIDAYTTYMKLIKENPDRFKVIDASQSIEAVYNEFVKVIKEFLNG